MQNQIFQIRSVHVPQFRQIRSVIDKVIETLGGRNWEVVVRYESKSGMAVRAPYSDGSLRQACMLPTEVSYGIHKSFVACGAEGIDAVFERINVERRVVSKLLARDALMISSFNIHFTSKESRQNLANLMVEAESVLSAVYGRVFCPRDALRRVPSRFDVFGGLPGLHPINFFGRSIADRIDVISLRSLPGAQVRESSAGLLLEFIDRTKEFTRVELEDLQPHFGKGVFLDFDESPHGASKVSLGRWLIDMYLENRKGKQMSPTFPYDFEPMLVDGQSGTGHD